MLLCVIIMLLRGYGSSGVTQHRYSHQMIMLNNSATDLLGTNHAAFMKWTWEFHYIRVGIYQLYL